MPKNNIKIMKKILATMSILAFSAGIVNISEAAIGRIPSISSRNHDTMQGRQGRNNDRFNNNDSRNNNRRNENQAPAPKEDNHENINANAVQSPEPRVESNRGNNNSRIGNRRNENNSRRMETPAKIVRDIDRTHDATYDEDDRYRAERESYYENDGNGRIVDHQIETIDDRHRASATESDRERGRETIINRYEGEDKYGNKKNDERGITVVVNNNIPIENNVKVDVKTENINENDNDIMLENKNNITSTNTNNNDNNNTNKTEANISGGSAGGIIANSKLNSIPKKLLGDLNHDNRVDDADINMLIDFHFENKGVVKQEEGDITGDGKINLYDILRLIEIVYDDVLQDEATKKRRENIEKRLEEANKKQETTKKRLKGDLNKDGLLNEDDVNLLKDAVFYDRNDFTLKEADFNNDGEINIVDVVRLIECVYDGKTLGYIDD